MDKKDYLAKRNQLLTEAEGLLNSGDLDGFNAKTQEIQDLDAQFEAISKAQANMAALKDSAVVPLDLQDIGAGDEPEQSRPIVRSTKEPLKLYDNFAQQLKAVKNAASGNIDGRLLRLNNEATGMGEGIGSEGGFAVQTDFGGMMMESAATAGEILSRVDSYNISGNSNKIQWIDVEEKSIATNVFGGVQLYWAAEAAEVSATKPKLIEKALELKKLMGIAYATYELENDSNFISTLYTRAFSLGIQRKLEEGIVSGSGAGQMLGFLTGNGKVVVPKETSQAADTVLWNNISKMYNRLVKKTNALWAIHPDVQEQLDFMDFPIGVGGVPVYLSASSVGSIPALKGKPIIESDHCSALGDQGDINFVDLSDYLFIYKGGVDAQSSIHVEFLAAENCFRFIFRANGMPKKASPVTIKNSDKARSSFVTLAARA